MMALRLVVDSMLFVLIWLVQVVIYPSFEEVDPDRFHDFHERYMKVISFFVVPLMLVQVGAHGAWVVAALSGTGLSAAAVVSLLSILLAWLSTAVWSVPCHRSLSGVGNSPELVRRLVRTNWLRTLAWTMVWVIGLTVAVRSHRM